ncbi:hypothetical protein [Allokutzneria sp. NRRL B-24872]|uniref:hypothetical protein n=1 Tax=Allokutzneria sp. NRRL B-24872 TaxID=1137961 RepID=UPI00143DA92C|nr:hypothetical protein [Allokutzneria sp. NRRL B-24872]
MSVQLVDAPTSAHAAAGDVEAELSVLSALESDVTGAFPTMNCPTFLSGFPKCCSLADF